MTTTADLSFSAPVSISLDMESVLANVHQYLVEEYNRRYGTDYTREDISDWNWVRREIDYDVFDQIVMDGWSENSGAIEPEEDGLKETVRRLHNHPGITVDIVTARTGVETAMQEWLENHGIADYRQFKSVTATKSGLGYDIYIDDKPSLGAKLSEQQVQYLIQGPHNTAGESHPQTIPIPTVKSAADHILSHIREY